MMPTDFSTRIKHSWHQAIGIHSLDIHQALGHWAFTKQIWYNNAGLQTEKLSLSLKLALEITESIIFMIISNNLTTLKLNWTEPNRKTSVSVPAFRHHFHTEICSRSSKLAWMYKAKQRLSSWTLTEIHVKYVEQITHKWYLEKSPLTFCLVWESVNYQTLHCCGFPF